MTLYTQLFFFFFFNDTATTEIYTLSLHDALPIWRRPRDLPPELAVRNGPVPGAGLQGARPRRDRAAAAARARPAGRGLDRRRAPRRVPAEPPPGPRGRAGALPHERARPESARARRGAVPNGGGGLRRRRARAEPPRPPGAPRAHAVGPPASRHALLPLALRDGPAGVLGGPGRRQAARARDRRRASQAHPLLRGAPVTGRERADRRQALGLLAPTLLALGALTVYPGFWVVWLSDRKSTRLNSSHSQISYAVFCLKKKNTHS